jgi:large subunit ribosomal protein L10
MPSQSILAQKQQFVADLAEKLKNAAGGVLVDYKGISVEDDTKLRKDLRENGVEYFVVKNTLLKRAAEIAGVEGLEPALSGTTAIALSAEDIIIAPKLLYKKAEESNGSFSIKLGFLDGKAITKEEVEEYAKLPSKETLLSQLVFMLQSPIQRTAIAINEIAKKQSEGEATA